METMYYSGLDVHKKTIGYCVKDAGGSIYNGHTLDIVLFRGHTSRVCNLVSRIHFRSDRRDGSLTCLSVLSVSLARQYH
jgi:hypothetical protein